MLRDRTLHSTLLRHVSPDSVWIPIGVCTVRAALPDINDPINRTTLIVIGVACALTGNVSYEYLRPVANSSTVMPLCRTDMTPNTQYETLIYCS